MSFIPGQAVALARSDVGTAEGPNNRNIYTPFQTLGRYNYQPYCASAVCTWTFRAGFRWDMPEHPGLDARCLFGERGDWNCGAMHQWAMRQGLWRSVWSYRAQPGDAVIWTFGIPDQHVGLAIGDAGGNIATIDGNSGPVVAFRSRPRHQAVGIVALTQSKQAGAPPPHPKELLTMGMIGGVPVPGAHAQKKDPWKGREPMVVAINHPDGRGDIVGLHGAALVGAQAYLGMSIVHVAGGAKLVKPMRSISVDQDKAGTWSGGVVVLADDYGTFRAVVTAVHYL